MLFMACKEVKKKDIGDKVIYDESYNDIFFSKNDWSYPDFVVKIDSTHFEDTQDGEISEGDTAHLLHTANIHTAFSSDKDTLIDDDNPIEKIRYGKAQLVGCSIILTFSESTPSYADDLIIKIKDGFFFTIFSAGSPPKGIRNYDFENQKLILQKKEYMEGDTIKGYLDFKVEKPFYAHLKGSFKVQLQ
jgi:hypothetical protein